jgi:hypothetical protein
MNTQSTPKLPVDRAQIGQFLDVLFPYAEEGTWLSLRSFRHAGGRLEITAIQLTSNAEADITKITAAAQRVSPTPNRRAPGESAPVRRWTRWCPRAEPQPALFRVMCVELATRGAEVHACVT